MRIVFYCQSCGSRFDLDAQAAGKQGRCKQCGQRMVVPKAEALASMTAAPRVAAAVASDGADWLARVGSQVALAPLTVNRMPGLAKWKPKPTPLDDLGDSKPYALVEGHRPPVVHHHASKPAGSAKVFWRTQLGRVQRAFRWINETAYLISVPFLMLILIGATVRNYTLALFGAEIVVLLNLGRIVSGVANIVVIPFRESPVKGVFFLIPPFTFIYMMNHWDKIRRPVQRVVGPLLTIGLVLLAFMFIPSLAHKGSRAMRLRESVESKVQNVSRSTAAAVKDAGRAEVQDQQ